jgi:hypothetical protein
VEGLDITVEIFSRQVTWKNCHSSSDTSVSVGEIAAISNESMLSSVFDKSTRARDDSDEMGKHRNATTTV